MASKRVTTVKLPERINPTVNKRQGILNADIDNAYYQRMESLIYSSGRLYQCVQTYRKFLRGRGFKDQGKTSVNDLVINSRGHVLSKLWGKICLDRSRADGWCIQINYNAAYEPTEYNWVPFKFVRLCVDDNMNFIGKFAIYDDWGKSKRKNIKDEDVRIINNYNPDPEVIQSEVNEAGGWDKYTGQLLWVCDELDTYPLAPFDSEAESAETDFRTKRFKLRNVATHFLASQHWIAKGNYTEKQEDELIEDIESFQGDDNAGKVFVEIVKPGGEPSEIREIKLNSNDKLFQWHETSVDEKIRKVFAIPPVLLGDLVAGRMGTQREMADAINQMNERTEDVRNEDVRVLQKMVNKLPGMENVALEIETLRTFTPVDIPTPILNVLTPDEKRSLVGFAAAEAKEETVPEKLGKLSPLLATKVMEVFTEEEIRQIFAGLPPKTESDPNQQQ